MQGPGRLCVSVPLVTPGAATSSTVMQIGNPPTQLHRCSPNHACTEAHAAINVPPASNPAYDEHPWMEPPGKPFDFPTKDQEPFMELVCPIPITDPKMTL
ncbi:hypothetical protein KM043_010955 [Ampulex compressa]|nr:hypothetical protein KM043_010955 [Ampulex compressa]